MAKKDRTHGGRIIDAIIDGVLVRANCSVNKKRTLVFVWSANAEEQLTSLVRDIVVEQTSQILKGMRKT